MLGTTSQPAETPHLDPAPPAAPRTPPSGRSSATERWLLLRMLQGLGIPAFRCELWDGAAVGAPPEHSVARVVIRDRRTLWALLADPMFQFGEGYADGRIEVHGSLADALVEVNRALYRLPKRGLWGGGWAAWLHRPRRNTRSASLENIHHHYNIGNDFYRLWLDQQLLYTCAYFAEPDFTLEQAQVAKLDHVCRKLRLKPGQTVFEAGCGWGALALHMARAYGVRVRAFNISREQIRYARERAHREHLTDQVEFVEDDWRTMQGRCDAFVSVGMLEHVGVDNYPELGNVIDRCLSDTGLGLIHSIGQNVARPFDAWTERRIFPGAYPPSLRQFMDIFEPREFSVLDVENIRLHYAETLRHWLDRFEHNQAAVRALFDDRFVRVWRLYLTGSMAAFEGGALQLFQVVFARAINNQIPRTRADLYTPQAGRLIP